MELCRLLLRDLAPVRVRAPSRFDRSPRWFAALLLAAVAALIAWSIAIGRAPPPPPRVAASPMQHDANLYAAVVARMSPGTGYYEAVAIEHRTRFYPLKPFVVVRPPLLATATVLAGGPAVAARALQALAALTFVLLVWPLAAVAAHRYARIGAVVIAGVAMLAIAQPSLAVWHEAWASLLVTLALAVHRPTRWWPSVVLALAAALIRELAVPFLMVMGFAAVIERRRAEAIGWLAAILTVAAALAVHAGLVAAIVVDTDRASGGWSAAGGWPFVVSMLSRSSWLAALPLVVTAPAIVLALLGWAGLDHPLAGRATLWLGGMMAAFMVVGRPDNFYWGMMLAPMLTVGLAFAPASVAVLIRRAFAAD